MSVRSGLGWAALATEDESPGEASEYPHDRVHDVMVAVLPAAEPHEPSDCSAPGDCSPRAPTDPDVRISLVVRALRGFEARLQTAVAVRVPSAFAT